MYTSLVEKFIHTHLQVEKFIHTHLVEVEKYSGEKYLQVEKFIHPGREVYTSNTHLQVEKFIHTHLQVEKFIPPW